MEFFVPTCRTRAEAESLWGATRRAAAQSIRSSVSDRRIFSARYLVGRRETLTTVGRPEAVTGEQILMIFAAELGFLIFTGNWGVDGGNPIPAGVPAEVLEFEAGQEPVSAGDGSSPWPPMTLPISAKGLKAEAGGAEGIGSLTSNRAHGRRRVIG